MNFENKITFIVVQYGDVGLLHQFLESLREHPDLMLVREVVIVNNGLSMPREKCDEILKHEYGFPIKITDNSEKSYSSGINAGEREATGEFIIISNNDIKLSPEFSLFPLLDLFKNPRQGVTGPQLIYPDGRWQHSYGHYPSLPHGLATIFMLDTIRNAATDRKFRRGHLTEPEPVDYIDGSFICIRRECFCQVGGFDEEFKFYDEETDFCYRARKKGWKIVTQPATKVIHLRGATSEIKLPREYARFLLNAQCNFMRKHRGEVQASIYKNLIMFAMWERKVLYNVIGKVFPRDPWIKRAEKAKLRYESLREGNIHTM